MKLSEIDRLPSFALLGPGFTGGPFRLISPLETSSDPSVILVPYEGTAGTASRWSGPEREIELQLPDHAAPLFVRLDASGHAEAVGSIRESIARGDVYQVNLTLRASLGQPRPADIFAALCRRAVPPYGAWIRSPEGEEIISASPELFFSVRHGVIRSQPMKGTAAPDQREQLAASTKDIAELAMITDLIRNDLTPLCEPRSVRVEHERRLLELPYAIQAVSDVSGRLLHSASLDAIIDALHPGGSVTGAPKSAARRIIGQLETTPRGPYCGTLGYVGSDGAVFSLLIRTAWRAPAEWLYGVGGGIVWDSEAEAELREVHLKLGALR